MTNRGPAARRSQNPSSHPSIEVVAPCTRRIGRYAESPKVCTQRSTPFAWTIFSLPEYVLLLTVSYLSRCRPDPRLCAPPHKGRAPSGSTSKAENILSRPPVPTPTSMRPRLNWSSVLRLLARWTGLCSGSLVIQSSFLESSRRCADDGVTMSSPSDTAIVLPILAAAEWGCHPGPIAAPRCPTGGGRAHPGT